MASHDEAEPTNVPRQAASPPHDQPGSDQTANRYDPPLDSSPREPNGAEQQFRLKLAMFGVVIIAAIIAVFVTGYPGWESYMAQEAAKRSLRAYIDVRPKSIMTIEEGAVPRVQERFENIGRTPAHDNGSFSRLVVTEYPLRRQFVNEECAHPASGPKANNPKANKWFVGKAMGKDLARESPFTAAEVDDIKKGNAAVYYHGQVCYRDIFHEPHREDFCLYWKWDAGRVSPGLYCDHGNRSG